MSARELHSLLSARSMLARVSSAPRGNASTAQQQQQLHPPKLKTQHRNSFDSLIDNDSDSNEESASLLTRARRHQPYFHKSHAKLSCRQRLRAAFSCKEGSIAIFLVLALLLLVCLIVIGGLLLRPFFTLGLLTAGGASLGFVMTEASGSGPWHHNREAENRFWIFVSIILSTTIVFAPDSPLSGLGSAFPVLGIMCVLISAGWVHYYDRKLEREELARAPHLRRVSSFILSNQESTKQKLQIVQDCLAALDYRFVAAKALNQKQIESAERDILNVLKSCEREELNYIVTNVNLALLAYKIKDTDILTFNKKELQNRTQVLELLARERLPDLNLQGRVVLLDALMNMRLKAHKSAELWVRDIILGTHGRMLTRLKNACDLKGRVHNFHKLVYRDISTLSIRQEIIQHLKEQAEIVKNDGQLPKERRKILSDVDDTLFSSGGKFPAGVDTSYPHHVLYPGVCFPESDTRVLTDHGFLYLDEIEPIQHEIKYACYEAATKQLVYRTGRLVLPEGDEHELINFNSADYQSPSYKSSSTSSPQLSLRVTRDHDMYVQQLTSSNQTSSSSYRKIQAARLLVQPCECVTPICEHRSAHIRMIACAEAGVETLKHNSFSHLLPYNIHTNTIAQLDAFLKVYALWLQNGKLDYDVRSISITSSLHLEQLLLAVGLASHEFRYFHSFVTITSPQWFKYFSTIASSPTFFRSLVESLDRRSLRTLLNAMCVQNEQHIIAHSATLRDDISIALLHAGYTPHFEHDASSQLWHIHFADPSNPDDRAACWPTLQQQSCVTKDRYRGHVWCVTVDHADHLIIAQRAERDSKKQITRASRPIIVGQCSFYKELDLGVSASGEWEEGRQGNLAFLSARPHVYKDKSERKSYAKFEELRLMRTMGLHCVPTLLSGSLDSGFHMFRGLFEPMSAKKFNNFTEYATLYPEFTFCFIGDNGQGDARAGELIKTALPDQVEAIFIHEVQPIHRTPGYVNYGSLAHYEKLGIHFFHTYVGAALQAARLGMIHQQGLRRIIIDSVLYFLEIKQSLPLPFHIADARRTELNRDIEAANAYLVDECKMDPVNMIPADCIFPVGSSVETSWGIGTVEKFNTISGIYQVRLTDWVLTRGYVRVYMHGSEITWHTKGTIGDAVSTRFGTGILTEIRELNGVHVIKLTEWGHAASMYPLVPGVGRSHLPVPNNSSLSAAPYAYLQPDDFSIISAAVGDQVQTMFGIGVVKHYRAPCMDVPDSSPSSSVSHSASSSISDVLTPGPSSIALSSPSLPASSSIASPSSSSTSASSSSSSSSSSSAVRPLPSSSSVDCIVRTMPQVHRHVKSHQRSGSTNVGIYVIKLAWDDSGGAIAFLNGRALRKIREPTQRRCVIQ